MLPYISLDKIQTDETEIEKGFVVCSDANDE